MGFWLDENFVCVEVYVVWVVYVWGVVDVLGCVVDFCDVLVFVCWAFYCFGVFSQRCFASKLRCLSCLGLRRGLLLRGWGRSVRRQVGLKL